MTASLIALTENLICLTEEIMDQFGRTRESGVDRDFFSEVKPFSDKVKKLNDQWRGEALEWVKETKPKNFHSNQIQSAHEQLDQISIQCFFVQTSKSRFTQTVTSVEYVLNLLLSYTKKGCQ